jgi:hypothetical protein
MRGLQKHANNNNRALVASSVLASILAVNALETSASIGIEAKKINLGPTEISKIVSADISERQALITADFSRDIYSENCKFQDEIDVYPIDQYVKVCIDVCYTSFSIRFLIIVLAFNKICTLHIL